MNEQNFYFDENIESEQTINLQKLFYLLWYRKWLMLKVGISIFFLLLPFI